MFSASPTATVQPVFMLLGRLLPTLCPGSAWVANWPAMSHHASLLVNKNAEERVLF